MAGHVLKWVSPSPLWDGILAARERVAEQVEQPTILRFADDRFMDDFLALMERDPGALPELRVRHETWRGPGPARRVDEELHEPRPALLKKLARIGLSAKARRAGLPTPVAAATSKRPPYELKLYQPGHQRYYLVAANLVCAITGFPDRKLDPGRQERVGFVVRRLLPQDASRLNPSKPLPSLDPDNLGAWVEYAFVPGERGADWRQVSGEPRAKQSSEEVLPMFPVSYSEAGGQRRRVLAGLVPVGRREAYMAAVPGAGGQPAQNGAAPDTRYLLFQARVTEPWSHLLERAAAASDIHHAQPWPTPEDKPLSGTALTNAVKAVRAQIQAVSWYVLLDFAQLLEEYVPAVWRVVLGQATADTLSPEEAALADAIEATSLDTSLKSQLETSGARQTQSAASLTEALRAISGNSQALEARSAEQIDRDLDRVTGSYAYDNPDPLWPDFLFPLADSEITGPLPPASQADDPAKLKDQLSRMDHLLDLIKGALAGAPAKPAPALPIAAQQGLDPRDGWFVLRCVFERPECAPRETALVSAATVPFQMAGFFDPDAPARPVRIGLPIDTTPAGLRKFDKNTAFMISDVLCGQISRMKGITLGDLVRSVLPWPLHKDLSVPDTGPCKDAQGVQAGMMCSLSIPIITICALILLMIIVNLLDFIFRWLPYFFVCFPLPGFKAKKDS